MKTKKQAGRSEISQEIIAAKAYDLWQQQGSPEGRSDEFWYEAERQLKSADFTDQPLRRSARRGLVTSADEIDENELQGRLDSVGRTSEHSATAL